AEPRRPARARWSRTRRSRVTYVGLTRRIGSPFDLPAHGPGRRRLRLIRARPQRAASTAKRHLLPSRSDVNQPWTHTHRRLNVLEGTRRPSPPPRVHWSKHGARGCQRRNSHHWLARDRGLIHN